MKYLVFGSNLDGRHGKGAALEAKLSWGAKQGQGVGLQGFSYAIPTKGRKSRDGKLPVLPLAEIAPHVADFLVHAGLHPEDTFAITRIGCGLAGYRNEDIAPLFAGATANCEFDPEWAPWGRKSWAEAPTMHRYWLSWWHAPALGAFELHSPWWKAGYGEKGASICAAVLAGSEENARQIVFSAYDDLGTQLPEFRFCERQADDWEPFCTRFSRAPWMRWPR